MTTATPTGNNDAYEFNFLESFSPKYQLGLFGNFELSDVIILRPEILYREYTLKQKVNFPTEISYNATQTHNTFSANLNFNIELSDNWSLIFGIGIDYLLAQKNIISNTDLVEVSNYDLSVVPDDQRLDPFTNIGLSFKVKKRILLDLEYRHLLDNWGVGNLISDNQLISSENGSVKLHMINLSLAFLL